MNEQQLTQTLQAIAEKEIPDMDKRDAIRNLILRRRAKPIWRTHTAVAAVVLTLVLISATVVVALYQSATDPGLTSVENAGLVQVLNVSKTVDGFTFQITKGYADANRVAVWFVITGTDLNTHYYVNSTLFEAEQPDRMFGTGSQSGYTEVRPEPNSLGGVLTFDQVYPAPEDGEFHLRLRLQLYKVPQNVSGDYNMQDYLQTSVELEFSLPMIGALELAPKLETTANGVTFSLNRLRIAPSQTALNLCFDMPSAQDWQPSIITRIGSEQGMISSMSTSTGKSFTLNDPRRCMDISFLLPYQEGDKQMVIEIDHLETSIPEANEAVLARAKERLAAQGIEIEFNVGSHGMGWTVLSKPEGLSEEEVNNRIQDSMREQLAGPWRFVVDLP